MGTVIGVFAKEGAGCTHCEVGVPVEEIKSRAGRVRLCLECVLAWFPGRDVPWWEERHALLLDHLGEALDEAERREARRVIRRLSL